MKNHGELINGVEVHELKTFRDGRGEVMRMMRNDDLFFSKFGEIYFSTVNPNTVKAWHLHWKMTLNYAVVVGRIKLVLYDGRKDSPTFEMVNTLHIDGYPLFEDYALVTIPPGVWNGFRAVGWTVLDYPTIVANCATLPHDPTEIERVHPDKFPLQYDWGPYEVAG